MFRAILLIALCVLTIGPPAPANAQEETGTAVQDAVPRTDVPPPPAPVYRSSGLLSRFPGYPYTDRRSVKAIDLGLAMTGESPVGWAGGLPFFYLDLAGTYANRFVAVEARTMTVPWLIDALIGVALINLNLAQSDDFPPLRQIFNPDGNRGVWELANLKSGFVFGASETTSWIYGFQSHLLLYGAPLGAVPSLQIGFGAALTRLWIHPTWDLSITLNTGPEISEAIGFYAGTDIVWRRALAAGFAGFLRWNAAGHYIPGEISSHGMVEAGISFGSWK